jgi:ABC-2 type transport system permease protein
MNYIWGEHLKVKRSFSITLIWLIPLINILISFIMSPVYFVTNTFNWWSILFMPIAIALWCAQSNQKEKKAGDYSNILLLPISLSKVWVAKIIVIALQALSSLLLFLIMMGLLSFVFPAMPLFEMRQLEGLLLIWFTSLWEIPLMLYLAKRLGMGATLITNIVGGMVLGIAISTRALWWLNPWSWSIRLMMPIIGVHPNGTLLSQSSHFRDSSVILFGILLAAALVIIITAVTSLAFKKSVPVKNSVKGAK